MDKLKLEKRLLNSLSSFIVFDIGTSLIKSIYVDQEDDNYNINTQNDDIIFTCGMREVSRGIDEMIENIKVRKSNLKNVESNLILLSGVKCERFESRIREYLMIEVKIVSEMEAIAKGVRHIIDEKNTHLIYPPEAVQLPYPPNNSYFTQRLLKSWKLKYEPEVNKSGNLIYPILYINAGTVTRFMVINQDGPAIEVSLNIFGGKTFLGLAKCLLNENNFDALLSLAEKGSRNNIDTQIKDILKDVEGSPYGKYPPELPLFAFGKAVDLNKYDIINFQREDISQSLVSMILENCAVIGNRIALRSFCKSIYIGGNLFQHRAFRIEYIKYCHRIPAMIKFNFIKGGMETSIGLIA